MVLLLGSAWYAGWRPRGVLGALVGSLLGDQADEVGGFFEGLLERVFDPMGSRPVGEYILEEMFGGHLKQIQKASEGPP